MPMASKRPLNLQAEAAQERKTRRTTEKVAKVEEYCKQVGKDTDAGGLGELVELLPD